MENKAFIGLDLGGDRAYPLEEIQAPGETLLVQPGLGGSLAVGVPGSTIMRIWGLHPLLVVSVVFRLRVQQGISIALAEPTPELAASIVPWPIVRSANALEGRRRLINPLPSSIFLAGGVADDGCELSCALQGVEFDITGVANASTVYELVAQVQVKQKVALGCEALARKLCEQIKIEYGTPALLVTGGA